MQTIKAELEEKKDVVASMDAELTKACECSSHVGGAFHSCHTMLSKYTEQVGLLSDRWRRILGQIDTRYVSLSLSLTRACLYQPATCDTLVWLVKK